MPTRYKTKVSLPFMMLVGFGLDGICPERLEKEALLYFDTEVKPKIEEELLEMEQTEQMEEEV